MSIGYLVMTSSARMPTSCWGRYRNVAVVETDYTYSGASPKMISTHARGITRVVRHFGPCHEGITARCEYEKTLVIANKLAEDLNNARNILVAEGLIS